MNNNNNYNRKAKNVDLIFGITAIVASLTAAGAFLFLALVFWATETGDNSAAFLSLVISATWITLAVKAFIRIEKSGRYAKIVGAYPRIKFSFIAKEMKKSLKDVSSDLFDLKKRGYFAEAKIDAENKELVFSSLSEPLPELEEEFSTYYKTNKALPLVAFIGALLTGVSFSLGVFPSGLIPAIITCAGSFFLILHFFPAPTYFTEEKRKAPKIKKPSLTGNQELDLTLHSIHENKSELVRIKAIVSVPEIRTPLTELIRVLDEIAEYATQNPSKVKSLRQFTSYYLPTTVSFLQTYEELNAKPDKGENINATLRKIEEMMDKLTEVYKKEYDELFSDRAMDISAEAAVMRSIINENN